MKKIINYIFQESLPLKQIVGGDTDLAIFISLTNCGVFIFFMSLAIILFKNAKRITPKEAYKQRILASYGLGLSMLFCSLSRGLTVLSLWHNYYFLNAVCTVLTDIFGLSLIIYSPFLFRAIREARELEEVKQTLKETSEKVDRLTDLSKKVVQKGN